MFFNDLFLASTLLAYIYTLTRHTDRFNYLLLWHSVFVPTLFFQMLGHSTLICSCFYFHGLHCLLYS